MKKKVLLIGDYPFSTTGCAGMLHQMLREIDYEKYDVTVFAIKNSGFDSFNDLDRQTPFRMVIGSENNDALGFRNLINILQKIDFNIVAIIGLDIWRYSRLFPDIARIKEKKKFVTSAIFPWDIRGIRKDWIEWVKFFDFPCVYSEYGYNMLKDEVPNINYFRPKVPHREIFSPAPAEEKEKIRKRMFPGYQSNEIIFGFVGVNQHRKDPQKLIKGFGLAHEQNKDIVLYLHTNPSKGVFNLLQYMKDCDYEKGWVRSKGDGKIFLVGDMANMYRSLDCLINCSVQEGLSYTPLEAMLCGVPVIATDTTSQTEIVRDSGILIPQTIPTYVPLVGKYGDTWMDAMTCTPEAICEAVLEVANNVELRKEMSKKGLKKAEEWLSKVSDFNSLLDTMAIRKKVNMKEIDKIDKILFMQHSSGGDVLMTTQCFKGIKEKHPNKELIFMTSKQYMGIVENNPYLDGVIEWDTKEAEKYRFTYNPHGEKILPGQWNNGDVKLYAMYPYFTDVEADDLTIIPKKPDIELPEKYIVVNTGGASPYRQYAHSNAVLSDIGYPVIQLGISMDPQCECAELDLRDRATWTESAYIMKNALAALVVDSFCAHLAGAMETPAVVLFGPAPARVVGPKYKDKSKLIELEPDKLKVCPVSANCYGAVDKSKCAYPCINTLNPITVKQSLVKLIEEKE